MSFTIKHTEKFRISLKKLIKSHYKKDKKGGKEFMSLINWFIDSCEVDYEVEGSKPEPFPKGTAQEKEQLRKWYFDMPKLDGSASLGRLIYLVRIEAEEVDLLWVYTHRDFEGRPPESELKKNVLSYLVNPEED